jgi:hypothetical protein
MNKVRECEYCRKSFFPGRKDQRFCCEAHRRAAWSKADYEKNRERILEAHRIRYLERTGQLYEVKERKPNWSDDRPKRNIIHGDISDIPKCPTIPELLESLQNSIRP